MYAIETSSFLSFIFHDGIGPNSLLNVGEKQNDSAE
jgi:hypothetical protein